MKLNETGWARGAYERGPLGSWKSRGRGETPETRAHVPELGPSLPRSLPRHQAAPAGPQCYQRQSVDVPRSFVDRLSGRPIGATNNGMTSGRAAKTYEGSADSRPIKTETPRCTSVIPRGARARARQNRMPGRDNLGDVCATGRGQSRAPV